MDKPRLSIIIVNWNSREFLRICLESIRSNIGTVPHEILVIDNASGDGCPAMLEEEFPDVVSLQSPHNLGFASANNLAFTKSRGEHILFLNPDTEVRPETVPALIEALEAIPGVGMVGAHLVNPDGSLQATCVTAAPSLSNQTLNSEYLRRKFPMWKIWGMRPLFETTRAPVKVQAISGACMLVKRPVLMQVGAFSTDYFMYLEDMDLCAKINNSGWGIYYVPDAVVVHHGGICSASRKETNFSNIMLCESLVRFFQIHRGSAYAILYRICTVLAASCRVLILFVASLLRSRRIGLLSHDDAISKWRSILIWALGFSRWARQLPLGIQSFQDAGQAVIRQASQSRQG